MVEFAPGSQFGPYRVLRTLGRGGMGAVYAAIGPSGAEVALKVLEPGGSAEDPIRFQREAEAHARVDAHPALARIHSAGQLGGRSYLVMDLLSGGDLQERLRAGPLPPEEVRALGIALAGALAHVHAHGILHRDLKPANVLFDEAGRPRLTDFGIARPVQASSLTQSGVILGTPGYMAPEQAGIGRPGVGSDVFGLGATLYAALSGQAPFVGATTLETLTKLMAEAPPPLPPSVPADLRAAIARALEKEPASRFPSAAAFADALQPPPSSRDASPWRLFGGALVLVGGVSVIALLSLRPRSTPLHAPSSSDSASPSPAPTATPALAWACATPVVVAPGGRPSQVLKTSSVVAAWIDDATFLTLADGGVYKVWQPDSQGEPRETRTQKLSPETFGVPYPWAWVKGGWLAWGGDSPLRFGQLSERDHSLQEPQRTLNIVAHQVAPLRGGRYVILNDARAAIWSLGAEELAWEASLTPPPGAPTLGGVLVLEERGVLEEGGWLELLVAWQPSEGLGTTQGTPWTERLRCEGEITTSSGRRRSRTRLREINRWRGGLVYGDSMGHVLTATLDLEEERLLDLQGPDSGPVRRVHRGPIRGLAIGLEGTLVTLGGEAEACVWDPQSGRRLLGYDLSEKLKRGRQLSLSPDRRHALIQGRDRVALISVTPPAK